MQVSDQQYFHIWSISVEHVPTANKLLKITVDLGNSNLKTVFSGIKSAYQPESLIGKNTLYLANLAPRKMKFGISEGNLMMYFWILWVFMIFYRNDISSKWCRRKTDFSSINRWWIPTRNASNVINKKTFLPFTILLIWLVLNHLRKSLHFERLRLQNFVYQLMVNLY